MRGDVLLYQSSGSWYERLICWRTKGPYVHVAVDVGDGMSISMEQKGIVKEPITRGGVHPRLVSTSDKLPHLEHALDILDQTLSKGVQYGWLDIFDQALEFVWPSAPVLENTNMDCSDLVYAFLLMGGYEFTSASLTQMRESARMTPNDIARLLGVL